MAGGILKVRLAIADLEAAHAQLRDAEQELQRRGRVLRSWGAFLHVCTRPERRGHPSLAMLGYTPRTGCAREFVAAVEAGTIDRAWFNLLPGFVDGGRKMVAEHEEAGRDVTTRRENLKAARRALDDGLGDLRQWIQAAASGD